MGKFSIGYLYIFPSHGRFLLAEANDKWAVYVSVECGSCPSRLASKGYDNMLLS